MKAPRISLSLPRYYSEKQPIFLIHHYPSVWKNSWFCFYRCQGHGSVSGNLHNTFYLASCRDPDIISLTQSFTIGIG